MSSSDSEICTQLYSTFATKGSNCPPLPALLPVLSSVLMREFSNLLHRRRGSSRRGGLVEAFPLVLRILAAARRGLGNRWSTFCDNNTGRRMARRCHPRRPLARRFSPGTPQRCPRGHEYSIGTQCVFSSGPPLDSVPSRLHFCQSAACIWAEALIPFCFAQCAWFCSNFAFKFS